jgi:hypothetical protein
MYGDNCSDQNQPYDYCVECERNTVKSLRRQVSGYEKRDKKMIKLRNRNRYLEKRYNELLMRVVNKYPGETRHETALRCITEVEMPRECSGTCKGECHR